MPASSSSSGAHYTSISDPDELNARAALIQEASNGPVESERAIAHNAAVGSKWGVGWKTPTLMWSFYGGAFIIALLHLLMFHFLDHKPTQGDKSIPQSYVTTASNILASLFAITLNTALSFAFTQHLWRVFRKNSLKVPTVEALYTVCSNPTSFFTRQGAARAPSLLLIALLIWTVGIAASFPTGAMTVSVSTLQHFANTTVPTFNASYVGNGQWDFQTSGLSIFEFSEPQGSQEGIIRSGMTNAVQRIAMRTMVGEQMIVGKSPCGSNCSYELAFVGPSFSCMESPKKNISSFPSNFQMYEGAWPTPEEHTNSSNNWQNQFEATVNRFIGIINGSDAFPSMLAIESHNITCTASAAQYALNVTYMNSIPTVDISIGPSRVLVSMYDPIYVFDCPADCVCCLTLNGVEILTPDCACAGNPQWSQENLNSFQDTNLYSIIDSTMNTIAGGYVVAAGVSEPQLPSFPVTITFYNGTTSEVAVIPGSLGDVGGAEASQNGTIITDTAINLNLHNQSLIYSASPEISLSESILNEILQNVTVSTFNNFNLWNTSVNATIFTDRIVYDFSRPLNIIIPYALSLALGLVSLILGTISLYRNGVPAKHGSFTQLLVTLTGSDSLRNHAAPGSLGGSHNVPRELKDMSIQFGDLTTARDNFSKGGVLHRAGFGVSTEVGPLLRTAEYGFAREKVIDESHWR